MGCYIIYISKKFDALFKVVFRRCDVPSNLHCFWVRSTCPVVDEPKAFHMKKGDSIICHTA